MIAKRLLIGLLITLFLPAPRGSDLSVFFNFAEIVLNFLDMKRHDNGGIFPSENQGHEVLFNVALDSDYPVDLFDGLLENENEIEKEIEKDEGKENKNSKFEFLSVLTHLHFDHEMIFASLPGQINQFNHHYKICHLILRC